MPLRPLHDYVLVQVDNAPEKVGSLFVPEKAKEKPARGEVLAVGPGRTIGEYSDGSVNRIPLQVASGNVVLFSTYAGQKVDENTILLHESDILAVEEK